jgi:hypothetical protein
MGRRASRGDEGGTGMIDTKEFKCWAATLDDDGFVAVDDGGLTIVELDADGEKTGAYYEIGGEPEDEED